MVGMRDKPRVWVLADESEEGVYVTNPKNDATVFVSKDGVKRIVVESPRTGRMLKKALVPARQIGSEGRYPLVKIGDQKVPVRPDMIVNPDDFTEREPEPAPARVAAESEFADS